MSQEYCDDCGRKLDLDTDDHESCSDCGEVQFCRVCADEIEERPTLHLNVSSM